RVGHGEAVEVDRLPVHEPEPSDRLCAHASPSSAPNTASAARAQSRSSSALPPLTPTPATTRPDDHSGRPPAKQTNRPPPAAYLPASSPPGATSGASSCVGARWATAVYALSGASTGPATSAPSMRAKETRC